MQIRKTLTIIGIVLGLACASTEVEAAMKTPSSVNAEATASTRITFAWNDSNVQVTGYKIERSLKPSTGFKVIGQTSGGARSYQDGGLKPQTKYYYRVRAFYGSKMSRRSPVASATTWAADALPTVTATVTPVPTATRTATALPTTTQTATVLPTATKTSTPVPTATSTPVPTSTATRTVTPVPTNTATVVSTATGTATPLPTATKTATPLPTATRTATALPTTTQTATALPTATRTATPLPTATSTPTRTVTPTPTPVATFDPVLVGFIPGVGSAQDVAASGATAFVASDPFGLSVVDTTTPTLPVVDGTPQHPFKGGRAAVGGSRAVVTGVENGQARLWVLDISEPQPVVLGELATTAPSILDVAINATGTVAATAMGASGIWIIDLSNPAAPVRRSVFDTAGTAFAVALDPTGTIAYVADGTGGLKVIGLGNLGLPIQLGHAAMSGIQRDIAVQGNVAYLADQMGRLVTVDITLPVAPQQIGAVVIGRYTFNVAVEGNRAIVHTADSVSYLEVIDVSSLVAPVVLGNVAVDAAGGVKGLALSLGRAYVADGAQGLKIYSISGAPSLSGAMRDDFSATKIATTDGLSVMAGAYLPTNTARVRVVDTSDPTLPEVVGELPTTVTAAGILDIAINDAGTVAVTAMGATGIWVIDLSNPAAPVRRSVFDTAGTAFAVALDAGGTLAYVADGSGGLKVVSLANLAAPSQIGNVAISGIQRDIAVQGGVVYLADQMGRMVTLDVATPSAPRQLGAVLIGRYTFNVAVHGTLAITHSSDTAAYVDVIDVTAPANPTVLGQVAVDASGAIKGLALVSGRAYVATGVAGVKIYGLGTPSAPVLLGAGYTVGAANDVGVEGAQAQAADSAAGISVIDLFAGQ